MFANRSDLVSRRALLRRAACGFGSLSVAALCADEAASVAASGLESALAPKQPHFPARAKNVIFLFMHGGPSHVDTFDPKPRLDRDHGKPIPFKRELSFSNDNLGGLKKSPWAFRQYGQSGIPVSDLFPHVGGCVDDLCMIHSMVGDGIDHSAAILQLHTGAFAFHRPSMGAWILYGLGSENRNLPGFVTIKPTLWQGGARNWSSNFLPGAYQGTPLGYSAIKVDDILQEPIEHLRSRVTSGEQRYELEFLERMNRRHALDNQEDPKLEARIQAMELAFRMQMEAPEALEVEKESRATKRLYGLDDEVTRDFGWQCLLARRLVERGVRFVQCSSSGETEKWDQHRQLVRRHSESAQETDKPIAGLLRDLKGRGLLRDTLVIWGGEFGRTPYSQEEDGRDHNPYGFTVWMAGGGVKPGFVYGATDEFGYHAVEDRMHIHDLHATVLHLLGLDHEKLTYHYAGRDFRLTDVHGVVAHRIIA